MTMKRFDVGGIKIACKTEGEGLDVVLLHGFCEDSSIWEDVARALVSGGFRVHLIDLPGYGESEVLPACSMEAMAEKVQGVVEQLGIQHCILIGHSMGGYVSMAFAERWPDYLKGLGLVHSHPFADKPERRAPRLKSAEFIRSNGHHAYVAQLIPNLFPADFAAENEELVTRLIEKAKTYAPEAIIGSLEAMAARPNRAEVLSSLTCPVLFIVGDQDTAIPNDQSLEQLPLPVIASVHLLEDIGHMSMFEAPEKVEAIVREFAELCSGAR